ncbi:hypothetical protein CRU98_08550 [Arcobacter sp. CECT 8986]|uniref:hypothetical protein n=1 Tax=Arcobacter sp. CECT 8986 TaxID=2044507 RepID=UPI001009A19C|nr:hypothetical protein [Arcobacter sp. CECT 8986]RXJ98805.1 hypothetical protein CRU98_08550 [Arcobacter sp. CECT 8986]
MDNTSIETIKEVIEHILKFRNKEIWDNENIRTWTYDWEEKDRLNKLTMERYDKPLVKLNNLLEEKEKYQEILEIEKEMTKIQAKKIISVKEFTEIYGYSSDWQKNRRGRIHDHLPYVQTTRGGKITYNVRDVEIWFENNNTSR